MGVAIGIILSLGILGGLIALIVWAVRDKNNPEPPTQLTQEQLLEIIENIPKTYSPILELSDEYCMAVYNLLCQYGVQKKRCWRQYINMIANATAKNAQYQKYISLGMEHTQAIILIEQMTAIKELENQLEALERTNKIMAMCIIASK